MESHINLRFLLGIILIFATGTLSQTQTCGNLQSTCAENVLNVTSTYANDQNLKTPDLIQQFGYPVETHSITTDDGYILTAFRIPYSNASPGTSGKIPVYLIHGILASSVQWLWQPANRALVFMLADAGFDVWIGNNRGTTYSRGHVFLNSSDPNNLTYWNYSHHELGKYDVAAAVNFITNYTNQPSIYYIGHSLGTTQFFVSATLNPELSPKIRTMFSLSTSGFIGNCYNRFFKGTSPLYAQYPFMQGANTFGNGQFVPGYLSQYVGNITQYCNRQVSDCLLCSNTFYLLFGFDICQTNFTTLPGVLAHLPDVTSVKAWSHISQNVNAGTFRQYDYGVALNPSYYNGALTPPDYDFSKFQNISVVIFYGDNDDITVPTDVNRTARALGSNLKEINRVAYPAWTHMDNVLAIDGDVYVYNRIITIMKNQIYG